MASLKAQSVRFLLYLIIECPLEVVRGSYISEQKYSHTWQHRPHPYTHHRNLVMSVISVCVDVCVATSTAPFTGRVAKSENKKTPFLARVERTGSPETTRPEKPRHPTQIASDRK